MSFKHMEKAQSAKIGRQCCSFKHMEKAQKQYKAAVQKIGRQCCSLELTYWNLTHFAFCSGSPSNSLLLIANIRSPTRILWSYASIELASIFFTTKYPLSSEMVIPLREIAGVKQRTLIPSQSFIANTQGYYCKTRTRACLMHTLNYQTVRRLSVRAFIVCAIGSHPTKGGWESKSAHSSVFVFGQTSLLSTQWNFFEKHTLSHSDSENKLVCAKSTFLELKLSLKVLVKDRAQRANVWNSARGVLGISNKAHSNRCMQKRAELCQSSCVHITFRASLHQHFKRAQVVSGQVGV